MKQIIILCFLGLILSDSVIAQESDQSIFAVAREDGRAFVYHGKTIPLSHGFNVYRSVNGDEWNKLTDEPFYPATDGYDFKNMIDDLYPRAARMAERDDPQAVFLRLRSGTDLGLIATAANPEIAKAVGRLYIDAEAPIGEMVYYRFEIVDDLGRATGTEIEGRTTLEPLQPPAPSQLKIENKADQVTLNWSYVPQQNPQAENVLRFEIYYREVGSEGWQKANQDYVARTIGNTEFRYQFQVPRLGTKYVFRVHAADYSGQLSPPSEELTASITENVPPGIIRNVNASLHDRNTARVTWPVATELDVGGYHLYRARGDEEEYTKITDKLIPALQTAYLDSTVQPDHQYRYRVAALDTLGNEGEQSNPANVFVVDYRVPDPASSISAEYRDNKTIRIRWESSEVPGGLRTYQLFRRQVNPPGGSSYSQLNEDALLQTTWADSGIAGKRLVEGTTLEYGVSIISENGNRSDTVYTTVKIPDVTPPESPSFLETSMQKAQRVSLKWPASKSRDVIRYRVYRRELDESVDSMLAEVTRSNRYFRDEAVPLGQKFRYSVSAVDSLDNESIGVADTLMTRRMHAPASARNVQAVFMNGSVQLVWEGTSNEQVVGYNIYRSDIATGVYEPVGETDSDVLQWSDPAGKAGLWYKVFPVDALDREARTATATQAVERK
ncbi:fibronectin type III domain-containing protein [Fodinibius sp.]|uniref:fibronectin type III domain-containing protein n=1 Tax=Fodinibius sp. TaxID=1872440 RepID=UPI002ACD73EF|nr:fibronectin type III domain-containing protein [Fodinibius sp.]MDZ7658799.1 fibronectin type III domain-containing protein [Fodinibius sp.]